MSDDSARKSYPLSRYLTSVQRLVREQIPAVWVHGVISQMTVRDRMCYITLAEYQSGDVKPIASLSLFLFAHELDALNRRLAALPKPFRLAQELKVSLLLQADFYIPQGRFQCKILDIDPYYTLGELALTRQMILARLDQEGLRARNASLELSPVPLKVGLITAQDSAAYRDFTTTLEKSGFAFEVVFRPARMQGQETEFSVLAAMGSLLSVPDLDVICLVRGGGGKTDLNYFDSEAICRAIALSPVPVLTGIGHEIDQSLADLVAWKACITPTDCARFLAERVAESWHRVMELSRHIGREVRQRIANESQRFAYWLRAFSASVPNRLRTEAQKLNRDAQGLRQGSGKIMQMALMVYAPIPPRLATQARNRLRVEWQEIDRDRQGLRLGAEKILQRNLLMQQPLFLRLQTPALHYLQKASLGLKVAEQRLRAADPEQTLKRGYSYTKRQEDGKVPAGPEDIRPGDVLQTRFAWGSVCSRVE